jgi:hypothetical protein
MTRPDGSARAGVGASESLRGRMPIYLVDASRRTPPSPQHRQCRSADSGVLSVALAIELRLANEQLHVTKASPRKYANLGSEYN